MKKYFLLGLALVLFFTSVKFSRAEETSWENVGSPGFSDNVVYANILRERPKTKELYIAYAEHRDNGLAKVLVKKFNGSSWEDVGDSENTLGYAANGADHFMLSFEFDSSGDPFIAYADESDSEKMKVKKLRDGAWIDAADMSSINSYGTLVSLAIDQSENLFLAYTERPWNDWRQKIAIKKLNGEGWDAMASGLGYYSTNWFVLSIDPETNTPHLAFTDAAAAWEDYDNNYAAVSVVKIADSSGEYIGEKRFAKYNGGLNLMFEPASKEMVLFYQTTSNVFESKTFKDGAWQSFTDSVALSNDPNPLRSYGIDSEIAFAPEGKLYLAHGWYDSINANHSCLVSKWENAGWVEVGKDCDGAWPQIMPSMLFSDGELFLSKHDPENGGKLSVVKKVEQEAQPDLETIFTSLEQNFQNESPYSPDVLNFKVQILNHSKTVAHNVFIKVSLNDREIETRGVGLVEVGVTKDFNIKLDSNLENAVLKIEAIAEGQVDADPSNDVLEQPLSAYFVDFRHDRDAFNFPNWGFSNYEEYRQELVDFIKAQWKEGDYPYFLAAILNGAYFNLGGAGGHCYGMMGDSIEYFLWPQAKPLPNETTYNLPEDVAKPNIIQRHWQQVVRVLYPIILPEIEASSYVYSASSQYQQIKDSIENQKEPMGVVLLGPKGKHAVVAYKVVELNDEKRVYIYENNSPLNSKKAENYISFKLNTNTIEYPQASKLEFDKAVAIGRWQFENTTEIKESIESTVKKYLLGLAVENIMIFNIHSPVEPIVVDGLGRKAGYLNGELINEIPNARIEQQLDSHIFYLPADLNYNFELVGTNSGVVGIDVMEPLNEKETNVKIFDSISVEKGKIVDIYWDENEKRVVDTTGNDVLPKNTGIINNTTANIVYGARQLKEQAFEKLSSAKLENKKWNSLISRTASEIESGLKDEYWQDQDHLNYPQGVNTFTADMRAVAVIEAYLRIDYWFNGFWKKNLSENTKAFIEDVVENLMKADRKLAEISIAEAKTKNERVHKKMIEQAEKAFDKAEKLRTDHPALAIDLYKNAWLFSQKSIKLQHGR